MADTGADLQRSERYFTHKVHYWLL